MKKNFMATALIAASLFSFSAFANPSTDNKAKKCTKTECNSKCDGNKQAAVNRPNPFEGITLTTEQQTKLNALTETQIAQYKSALEKKKEDAKSAREQRMAERKNSQREYLNGVKAILTPTQYVTFLENMVLNQPSLQGKGSKMMKPCDSKKDKADKKCDKKDKKEKK